jgi:anti-sigma B factor antagonist
MSHHPSSIRHSGPVAIVDLSGRITLSEGAGAIRNSVKKLLQEGDKKILLNLADVSYMDSAGLGEMAAAFITVSNIGGKLKVVNASSRIEGLLQVTKLSSVLTAYPDEEAALASFA